MDISTYFVGVLHPSHRLVYKLSTRPYYEKRDRENFMGSIPGIRYGGKGKVENAPIIYYSLPVFHLELAVLYAYFWFLYKKEHVGVSFQ